MSQNLVIVTPSDLEQLLYEVVERVVSNHLSIKNKDDPSISYPSIMGTEQAAAFLGISESTLYRYTSNRLIPFQKRYQKLYFKKNDLEQWVTEGNKKTVTQLVSTNLQRRNQHNEQSK